MGAKWMELLANRVTDENNNWPDRRSDENLILIMKDGEIYKNTINQDRFLSNEHARRPT